MKKLLTWLDKNILTYLAFFLLLFIPLYPKLPIMELLPGYIVRVRLEDFFILGAFIIFLIQIFRKKASFKTAIFWPMIIYLSFGFLSILSGIFISKTIPLDYIHVLKAFLHWLRRVEYFSIFFIFYNGIRNLKDTKILLGLSVLLTILVSIYGYGQKYLYWPVYSTMNREFSKGVKLYLTEHARVPSTFGGHYDLAAFLVIFLILFVSLFYLIKQKKLKASFLIAFLLGYWLLILSASRTSFIAYIAGLTVLFFILAFKKGWLWAISRWTVVFLFSFFIMIFFGDLSTRFSHFLKLEEIKEKWNLERLVSPFRPRPTGSDFIALSDVMDKTDERPVLEKPGGTGLPPGVFEKIPDYKEVTISGELEATIARVPVERTFSENAYKYGLSTAIRLDALWPQAIAGFMKNPLLGSGYSTLNKQGVVQFTEAESTDNDYLRALGETGLLGFLAFFGIIFIALKKTIESFKKEKKNLLIILKASFIAFTVALLINALYIDVFEASKVAFMFWAMTGVTLASIDKKKAFNNT